LNDSHAGALRHGASVGSNPKTKTQPKDEMNTQPWKYVSEEQWKESVEAAQCKSRLGHLRRYLRPILAQEAKNIAQAAASGISDFEAMKRGREMLERIETEET
jgi:hypothetical protein